MLTPEQTVLNHRPSINDIVNEINPIPWKEFLWDRCEIYMEGGDAICWQAKCATNCFYVTYKQKVFAAYGYHGKNLFNDLSKPGKNRNKYFKFYAKFLISMNALCERK